MNEDMPEAMGWVVSDAIAAITLVGVIAAIVLEWL